MFLSKSFRGVSAVIIKAIVKHFKKEKMTKPPEYAENPGWGGGGKRILQISN